MNLTLLRRLSAVAVAATCLVAVPSHAQGKHRAVRHPAPAVELQAEISGTVVDSVTGAPVVAAHVTAGSRSDTTDQAGKFLIKNITAAAPIVVEAERSGYKSNSVSLSAGGKQTVSITLVPTPTVRLRKTDNTVLDIDFESIQFGYPIPFSGYRSAEFEDFCRADGTPVVVNRSEIKRIIGPATPATIQSACCPSGQTVKITVELKSGATSDMYFSDACNGFPNIDFMGREHVSAKFDYIPFTQIAEVVFP